MRPVTVVVAYREPLVAEALASALGAYPWIAPIGIGSSGHEVEECASRADAVAIDRELPRAEEIASRLRRQGIRVVLIGDHERRPVDSGNGVEGSGSTQNGDGVSVSSRDSISTLARALASQPPHSPSTSLPLTRRQREILDLVAKGLACKQVARQLGISPKTVERHKTRMFERLGVANQTAAVSLAMSQGNGRSWAWNPSSI
jgi:DNA-binding CsgD family transcriptional regulator